MRTALIIHGTPSEEVILDPDTPSETNKHWIPWLQNQLLIRSIHAQTPEMPKPFLPHYGAWSREFERFDISDSSLLIGHSCGGGFLLRWLSENPVNAHRLILVAPWIDPKGMKDPEFFNFDLDPDLPKRIQITIFASDNDSADIDQSIKTIHETLSSVELRVFPGCGHFCYSDMNTNEFPELLEALIS